MDEFNDDRLPFLEAGEWWRWYPSAEEASQSLATKLREARAEIDALRARIDATPAGRKGPLRLYADDSGWLIAARSFADLERLAVREDIQGEGGWRRLSSPALVEIRAVGGGRVSMPASKLIAAGVQRGVVTRPRGCDAIRGTGGAT